MTISKCRRRAPCNLGQMASRCGESLSHSIRGTIETTHIVMIRQMRDGDAAQVLDIYAYGLATRNATFETKVPTWEEWKEAHHSFCRLVYVQDDKVVGWVALSPMSHRSCYRGVAEISVYLADGFSRLGIGTRLLKRAVEESERNGIWTLFASVFPENEATVRLHLRQGFRKMGIRKRIAQLDGQWRDTLILERRSDRVGVD